MGVEELKKSVHVNVALHCHHAQQANHCRPGTKLNSSYTGKPYLYMAPMEKFMSGSASSSLAATVTTPQSSWPGRAI